MIWWNMLYKPYRPIRFPLPSTDAEFSALTDWLFGMPLSIKKLWIDETIGSYEFTQDFDHYTNSFRSLGKYLFQTNVNQSSNFDYDANDWLVSRIFGPTYCGGIARAAYAQFTVSGHRNKTRLRHWAQQRCGIRSDRLRPAFERLATHRRAWREQNDSR